MTHAHNSGAYNIAWQWAYINDYYTGRRFIWCMTDPSTHSSMFEAFECIINDFGDLVKIKR